MAVDDDKDSDLALARRAAALKVRSDARRHLAEADRLVDEVGRKLGAAAIVALHAYNLVLVHDLAAAVAAVQEKYGYDPDLRIFGEDIVVLVHDRAHMVELAHLRTEIGLKVCSPSGNPIDDAEADAIGEAWGDDEDDAIVRFGFEHQYGRDCPRPKAAEVFAKIDQLRMALEFKPNAVDIEDEPA